jgi:hypothetical protein
VTLRVISAALVHKFGWEGLTALGRDIVVLVTRLEMISASMESAAQGGMPVDAERYAAVADLQCNALDALEEDKVLAGRKR